MDIFTTDLSPPAPKLVVTRGLGPVVKINLCSNDRCFETVFVLDYMSVRFHWGCSSRCLLFRSDTNMHSAQVSLFVLWDLFFFLKRCLLGISKESKTCESNQESCGPTNGQLYIGPSVSYDSIQSGHIYLWASSCQRHDWIVGLHQRSRSLGPSYARIQKKGQNRSVQYVIGVC